jgi:hypothetical protein
VADQLELPEPSDDGEPSDALEPSAASNGHDDAALAAAARHALHDEELVAAFAAGALEADEADEAGRARALVERCIVCRDLHADLVTIATAHRATAGSALAASRDFRLGEEDAVRLRPEVPVVQRPAAAAAPAPIGVPAPQASFLERLRAAFGSIARPLGGTLVAAGLVGILLGSVTLAAIPAAIPSSGGYDRTDVVAPEATGGAAEGSDDGSKVLAAESPMFDWRLVVIGVSGAGVLFGLVLLARSRRRASESS